MNKNTKLEIAVEIMAAKIAKASHEGVEPESEEMKMLLKEKVKMYQGDEEIIEKIINIYGKEIKK